MSWKYERNKDNPYWDYLDNDIEFKRSVAVYLWNKGLGCFKIGMMMGLSDRQIQRYLKYVREHGGKASKVSEEEVNEYLEQVRKGLYNNYSKNWMVNR